MTALQQIGAMNAHLRDAAVHTGAARTIDTLTSLASGARRSITSEMFMLDEAGFVAALRERAQHIPIRLHGDTQYIDDPAEYAVGTRDGISTTSHGASPIKLHTKLLVADGERGYLGTAAPVQVLHDTDAVDFGATVGATQARLIEAATNAAISGDTARIRSSAADLAPHGIYLNDVHHGVYLLRDRIESMIDGARSSIYVGSKILGDEPTMKRIAAAQARGVNVLVETTSKARPAELQQARDAGVDANQMAKSVRRLHGNIVVVDDHEAYMGTAMLSERGMGRPTFSRDARESGWVTRDRAAIDEALDAIQGLEGSRLAEFRGRM